MAGETIGFIADTGWDASPEMVVLPEEVYTGKKRGAQNVQKTVQKHLDCGSMWPLPGAPGHTKFEDES